MKNCVVRTPELARRLERLENQDDLNDDSDFDASLDSTPCETPRGDVPNSITDSLGQSFVRIAPGTFRMGNALSSEELVQRWGGKKAAYDVASAHEVTLTRDYYLCRYPVRFKDFARFVDAARYKTTAEIEGNARGFCQDGVGATFQV